MKTGAQYLDSLRDGREVWIDGERVTDVTAHPLLGRTARTIGRLYDLQHDPRHADTVTFTDARGERHGMAHYVPRSVDDLTRLRRYHELVNLKTGGLWGRLSAVITIWHAYSMDPVEVYERHGPSWLEHMGQFADHLRRDDLAICGAFHGPSGDRSKAVSAQDDPDLYLRIVERRRDGVVVNGYRVATLAPFANEIYLVPWAFLREDEGSWAFAGAVPANAKGVKIVCREPLTTGSSTYEYPLSACLDEMDAQVIFDHVFVPNERIFCEGSIKVLEEIHLKARVGGRIAPGTVPYIAWISQIQFMARVRLMLGVAYLMTRASGAYRVQSPALLNALSEMIQIYQQVRAFVRAAEVDPIFTKAGLAVPRPSVAYAGRHFMLDAYYRVLCRFHEVVGGTTAVSPRERDLRSTELGPYVRKYLRGVEVDAERRLRLIRLARDLGASAATARMQLFNHHADANRDSFIKQIVVYFEDLGEGQACIDEVEGLLKDVAGLE